MNSLQNKASNPEISTWVSASAGTGKTKILTDRVLRLLLKGEGFDKILCLTFTNAAAGEMKQRITTALDTWSKLDKHILAKELNKIIGREATTQEISIARSLYDSYLKAEDSINIQTIHSFCQKLLKKFPLEASVSPSFKIIDEIKVDYILSQIKKHLMYQDDLEPITEYLSINFHELIIDEILSEIIQHKAQFLKSKASLDNFKNKSIKLILELQNSNDSYYDLIKQSPVIQNIVAFKATTKELKEFFLTQQSQKKKRIVTQKIAKAGSNLYSDLETIQDQIYTLDQKEKAEKLKNHSKLLFLLGSKIIEKYENYKSIKALLDYDDLIIYACKLLNDSAAKEWVLYKLDGGIDHLLVDEAQDTSNDQWSIIKALIDEFYSGHEAEKNNRTVFVVGDEKQSIFSFQGADIDSFSHMNKFLKKKMSGARRHFENVNLEISYRSAKEVLDVVYHVFNRVREQMPGVFSSTLNQLQAFRSDHSGSVELWPICSTKNLTNEFWPIIKSEVDTISSKVQLAQKISSYIKHKLGSGQILAATNKAIAPNDFMILFRKRDEFTKEVISALQNDGVPVAGLDRITLRENLAVQDLLSIGKFVLNCQDNLNLATLLKSPTIGINEAFLYDISIKRGKHSIWDYINLTQHSSEKHRILFEQLSIFLEIYQKTNVKTFFQYIVDILGFRETLNIFCGPDSNDAIDELLYACQDYASENNNSLQSFIFWIQSSNSSIKRDSSSSDKVKIMTLHGSKGLQSPIVLLCDTTSLPTNNNHFIWDKDGNCLSARSATDAPDYYRDLYQLEQEKIYSEYLRLLYVGMTRAEDHLVVCGYTGNKSIAENCWFELVNKAMKEIAVEVEDGRLIYGTNSDHFNSIIDKSPEIQRIEYFYPKNQILKKHVTKEPHVQYIPTSLWQITPAQYGVIFHKILEDSVAAKEISSMHTHPLIGTLDKKSQKRIKKSIKLIAANIEFNRLIEHPTLTELSIGTLHNEKVKLGRIDLMIHLNKEIIIIDYKSDLNHAINLDTIPKNYINQLLSYKEIVEKIYPDHKIYTKILWLESGDLMEVSTLMAN
jgi:ATP-dependent helicase/nuclease subunit A